MGSGTHGTGFHTPLQTRSGKALEIVTPRSLGAERCRLLAQQSPHHPEGAGRHQGWPQAYGPSSLENEKLRTRVPAACHHVSPGTPTGFGHPLGGRPSGREDSGANTPKLCGLQSHHGPCGLMPVLPVSPSSKKLGTGVFMPAAAPSRNGNFSASSAASPKTPLSRGGGGVPSSPSATGGSPRALLGPFHPNPAVRHVHAPIPSLSPKMSACVCQQGLSAAPHSPRPPMHHDHPHYCEPRRLPASPHALPMDFRVAPPSHHSHQQHMNLAYATSPHSGAVSPFSPPTPPPFPSGPPGPPTVANHNHPLVRSSSVPPEWNMEGNPSGVPPSCMGGGGRGGRAPWGGVAGHQHCNSWVAQELAARGAAGLPPDVNMGGVNNWAGGPRNTSHFLPPGAGGNNRSPAWLQATDSPFFEPRQLSDMAKRLYAAESSLWGSLSPRGGGNMHVSAPQHVMETPAGNSGRMMPGGMHERAVGGKAPGMAPTAGGKGRPGQPTSPKSPLDEALEAQLQNERIMAVTKVLAEVCAESDSDGDNSKPIVSDNGQDVYLPSKDELGAGWC